MNVGRYQYINGVQVPSYDSYTFITTYLSSSKIFYLRRMLFYSSWTPDGSADVKVLSKNRRFYDTGLEAGDCHPFPCLLISYIVLGAIEETYLQSGSYSFHLSKKTNPLLPSFVACNVI